LDAEIVRLKADELIHTHFERRMAREGRGGNHGGDGIVKLIGYVD
jgi:hypothetical protein